MSGRLADREIRPAVAPAATTWSFEPYCHDLVSSCPRPAWLSWFSYLLFEAFSIARHTSGLNLPEESRRTPVVPVLGIKRS